MAMTFRIACLLVLALGISGGARATMVAPLAFLSVAAGDGQRAVTGTTYADSFVARAVRDDGTPLAFVNVAFRTSFTFVNTTASGETFQSFQDMWWSGFSENGWGMSVAKHDDRLFSVIYAYDEAGKPTWFVKPFGEWEEGLGSTHTGPIYAPRGSPFFAYDRSRFEIRRQQGFLRTSFRSADRGSFLYGLDSKIGTKSIVRQDYATNVPAPLQGLADMWWGGEGQAGWGMAIMEQFGGLFSVWFTYDETGERTWFVMPAGNWIDSSTYAGRIYIARGSAWVGQAYDASRLQLIDIGTFSYRFAGTLSATFDYSVNGRAGTMALTRQLF